MAITRSACVSSFTLLSVQSIFMSLAFFRLPPSPPFYSLINYLPSRFPTVLPVQCDRGWDRVFLVGGTCFWVARKVELGLGVLATWVWGQ